MNSIFYPSAPVRENLTGKYFHRLSNPTGYNLFFNSYHHGVPVVTINAINI